MMENVSAGNDVETRLNAERSRRFAETGQLTRLSEAQRQRLTKLEQKIQHLQQEKEAMLASTSWRLTAPIRALGAILGR